MLIRWNTTANFTAILSPSPIIIQLLIDSKIREKE